MICVLIVIALLLLGGIGVLRAKAHADVRRRCEADSKLVEEAPLVWPNRESVKSAPKMA